jgi:hypothetical protein
MLMTSASGRAFRTGGLMRNAQDILQIVIESPSWMRASHINSG